MYRERDKLCIYIHIYIYICIYVYTHCSILCHAIFYDLYHSKHAVPSARSMTAESSALAASRSPEISAMVLSRPLAWCCREAVYRMFCVLVVFLCLIYVYIYIYILCFSLIDVYVVRGCLLRVCAQLPLLILQGASYQLSNSLGIFFRPLAFADGNT